MSHNDLERVAAAMVAKGKGILAADESNSTCNKRFEKPAIQSTEEHRRAYRELLFTTPDVAQWISGVILYDETQHGERLSASDHAQDGRNHPCGCRRQGAGAEWCRDQKGRPYVTKRRILCLTRPHLHSLLRYWPQAR